MINMHNRDDRWFIDNKELIAEIEKRPVIWDSTVRLSCDKQLKKEAWDELVNIFYSNPPKDETNELCRILQRKWKSARDCFSRECQRLERTKQGLATSRKSPYMYYNNLAFLHKIMNKNKSVNGTKNEECTSNDTSSSTDVSSICNIDISVITSDSSSASNTDSLSPNIDDISADTSSGVVRDICPIEDVAFGYEPTPKRQRTEIDEEDSIFTRILQPNIKLIEGKEGTTASSSKTQEEDSDRLFLLSLHEPLKQVPKQLQMSVRIKIMQVVDNAIMWKKEVMQE